MTPAETIWDELDQAQKGLRRCQCGSAVAMAAQPGVTWIHCLGEKKTVASLPDWQPQALKAQWNKGENEKEK